MELFRSCSLRIVHECAESVVEDGVEDENEDKKSGSFVVEEDTDEEKEGVAQESLAVKAGEQGKNEGEESPKVELREE